jgi:glycosyltransferase involved in cell wall biosynthesis
VPPKISIQICSYNRKDLLRRSLEALFRVRFAPEDYEVLVVDDGSTDGTYEMLCSLEAPCALKPFRQEKAGLAKGRNTGIRNAKGEVILFIDDDIIADPDLLRAHWATHEKNPRCIVMGWVNHVDSLEGKLAPRFTMADISTSYFWTSNVSVRKHWLEEAGLFDEDFTEYGWEDLELGLRLRALGLVRKFNFDALVYHYKSRWKAEDLPRLLRQAEAKGRTAVLFVRKVPTWRARLATGIYPLRLLLDDIVRKSKARFESVVGEAREGPLRGAALSCARKLVTLRYFETIKTLLAAEKDRA